jgi:predicted alpha/beta-fold hydrolase
MGCSLGGNIVVNALAEQGCGWQDAMGKDAKRFMKMIELPYMYFF